ncbi:CRISPR-associated endonuclease Cas2 [Balnearium lithotrophicum]|uniref:CRISPR-associated endoribonuclease Cas2 n=1 Tax=Balnearium lithotrophicum TaxID=223788 RepID=A0A521DHI9_9BACT|nr:CRISPR-associated endonuclease Cas2 [Balnearium lithotrophicum]SMO71234.1 CRISPR-associated endonuclease Cas2 [Balnearium lithotrophicum]
MSLPKRVKRFVVVYDICMVDNSYSEIRSSAKRRAQIMRILYDYGVRTQLSVFEVELKGKEYFEVSKRLEEVIRKETDRVFIYPLDERSSKSIVRIGQEAEILGDLFI